MLPHIKIIIAYKIMFHGKPSNDFFLYSRVDVKLKND